MQNNAADLLTLWEKMKCEVTDKTSLRYLNKFGELVKKIVPNIQIAGVCIHVDPKEPPNMITRECKAFNVGRA